jgi:hypothetical protein
LPQHNLSNQTVGGLRSLTRIRLVGAVYAPLTAQAPVARANSVRRRSPEWVHGGRQIEFIRVCLKTHCLAISPHLACVAELDGYSQARGIGRITTWDTVDNEARVRHAEIALQDILGSTPFQKIGLHVRLGELAWEIVTFAEHFKAELIVLPSHGRTGLSRLLIGSVAERRRPNAHCPVPILRGLSRKDG